MVTPRLRIGRISYANCDPFFQAWEKDPPDSIQLVHGHPRDLNRLFLEGKLDAGPLSSIFPLRAPRDRWEWAGRLGIACEGAVQSIRIYFIRPLEEGGPIRVLRSPHSETGNAMASILLPRITSSPISYEDSPLRPHEARILIGNAALEAPEGFPYFKDLGQEWWTHFQLPFVYALFLVRPGLDDPARRLLDRLIAETLEQLPIIDFDELAHRYAPMHRLSEKDLREYYPRFRFILGNVERAGLAGFLEAARTGGLAPCVKIPLF